MQNDLVTRLIADSQPYTSGISKARAENDVFKGSVNSIIGQLERQKQAMETSTRSTLDWIEADKKASAEAKELAKSLLDEVDALKKLDAARKSMPSSSVVGNGLGVPSDKQRDEDARRKAGVSGDKWREEDEKDKERQENIRKRNLDIANERRAETDAEDRKREANDPFLSGMRTYQQKDGAADPFQRGLRNIEAERKKNEKPPEEKKPNRAYAGVEAFRAIEDFSQGAAYGGLRGGLVAASNNISQMGAAFGAAGAMAGSAVSTVIVLGSTLYETWRKASDGSNAAKTALQEYDRMTTSVLGHTRELQNLRNESRDIGNQSSFAGANQASQSLKDEIKNRENDIKAREEARKDLLGGMGATGMTSADLTREASRREETVYGLRRNAASAQAANLSEEALTLENRQKLLEQERQHLRDNDLLYRQRLLLEKAERVAAERGQAEADRNQAVERSRRVGGAGPLTEWQQMDKERGFANTENAKQKDRFERGQSWFQKRSEDILLSGMKEDKDRKAYQAQKEHEQTLLASEEAARMGIISESERAQLDAGSLAKRDKDIREAKFGNLQADGNTGFQSADVRSSQGFNAILKSIRYSAEEKTISELKRNGDITLELKTAVENGITIKNLAPVPVMTFGG